MAAFQFASARKVNAVFKPRTVTCHGYINGRRANQRRKQPPQWVQDVQRFAARVNYGR